MITPEQLEQQLQADRVRRLTLNSKVKLQKQFTATPATPAQNLTGLDNLNQQINKTAENLKSRAGTELQIISTDLGIVDIAGNNPTLPNICPSPAVLAQILNRRNNLLSEIEVGSSFINTVGTILNTATNLITGTETAIETINILKLAASTAIQTLPAVPGGITAALSSFDDVRTILTYKADGTPKLPEIKRALETGANYTTQAGIAINKILQIVSIVDQVLIKCGQTPEQPGVQLQTLSEKGRAVLNSQFESSYKGFTFSIIDRPFSPTVNRKVGQALNSEGIVLLQTQPSFTENPQVLVEELKLIIDRDNLKAN
jgi:hypothetical protein